MVESGSLVLLEIPLEGWKSYLATKHALNAPPSHFPQPGVLLEEAGAAVAAESSTGTWTTVSS